MKIANDWYEVIAIADGISLIRERYVASWLRCNMWHVQGRNHDILIDTGMGVKPLKKTVAQLCERPVTAVQSHSHFDHAGCSHEFDTRLGHKAEAYLMAEPHADDEPGQSGYAPFVCAETFKALPYDGFDWRQYDVRPAPLTGHLDEGDAVDLGDRHFHVLHLPGHSPGSIGLWEKATKTLFSGDAIYNGELLDSVYHSDQEIYLESLARLKELPVETIHGGHYGSFNKARLEEIITSYQAGGQRIGDANKWVAAKIAEGG